MAEVTVFDEVVIRCVDGEVLVPVDAPERLAEAVRVVVAPLRGELVYRPDGDNARAEAIAKALMGEVTKRDAVVWEEAEDGLVY